LGSTSWDSGENQASGTHTPVKAAPEKQKEWTEGGGKGAERGYKEGKALEWYVVKYGPKSRKMLCIRSVDKGKRHRLEGDLDRGTSRQGNGIWRVNESQFTTTSVEKEWGGLGNVGTEKANGGGITDDLKKEKTGGKKRSK